MGIGLRLSYEFFIEGYYSHGFTDLMVFYENRASRRGFMPTQVFSFKR